MGYTVKIVEADEGFQSDASRHIKGLGADMSITPVMGFRESDLFYQNDRAQTVTACSSMVILKYVWLQCVV